MTHVLEHQAVERDAPKAASAPPAGFAQQARSQTTFVVQRSPRADTPDPAADPASNRAAPAGLILDDSATDLAPGQMRKSDFLAALRAEICRTAERALAGSIWSLTGCPWIDRWIGYYQDQDAAHIERAARRYAPETSSATSATDYIPLLAARVRHSIEVWSDTGEITGVPEDLPADLPGMGILGAIGGLISGVAGAISDVVSGVGSLISGIGSLFFKAREGGAHRPADPPAIQAGLGSGDALDSGVRTRMEPAFGHDFSRVRIHADAMAAEMAGRFNARAFTIGEHIAFGAGEYRPGTLVGDALAAHELAHVVQQDGSRVAASGDFERDADIAAVRALAGRDAMPLLRSGLRLQRCAGANATASGAPTATTQPAAAPQAAAVQPNCPPTLEGPRWTVASTPNLVRVAGCNLNLSANRQDSTGFGINGMEFRGTARVTPNCAGRIYFVQYARPDRRLIGCVDSHASGVCASQGWGLDTAWPYRYATNADTERTDNTPIDLRMYDSPGMNHISNPGIALARVCMHDEFVTYIVYENAAHNLTSLGWMHWQYHATAWRDTGSCPLTTVTDDCRGWQVNGTGEQMGDSFVTGNPGPVPLTRNAPIVTLAMSDCPETQCVRQ